MKFFACYIFLPIVLLIITFGCPSSAMAKDEMSLAELSELVELCSPTGSTKVFEREGLFEKCIELYKTGKLAPVTTLGKQYIFRPFGYMEKDFDKHKISNPSKEASKTFAENQSKKWMLLQKESNIEAYAWLSAGIKSKYYVKNKYSGDEKIIIAEQIESLRKQLSTNGGIEEAEQKAQTYYKNYVLPYESKYDSW